LIAILVAATVVGSLAISTRNASAAVSFETETLNGAGNNVAHPTWGTAGSAYTRVGAARYADGHSQPVAGPNSRYVSNRVFNDVNQNVFSEHRATQMAWTWGQFLDHTFGLAQGGTETANIPFNSADPLERFTDTLGYVPFTRDAAVAGTGTTNARQAVNTINSYLDASAVYGGTPQREEWLRSGPVDNNLANNAATLMLPNNYLPKATSRGNAATAPTMAVDGRLLANPGNADVAGDVRANENIELTSIQTLFAREHNRIVSLLPASLSQEDRFQIARRIVIAEQQYITYNEFLPAMGVTLPAYTGYQNGVNTTLSTEFATVGYRAHSQIHGEFSLTTEASRYTPAQLANLTSQGVEVTPSGSNVDITVPTAVGFFNPDLVSTIGLGPLLTSLEESQYKNDEMIDDQLRSILFQVPVSGNPECLNGPDTPQCFNGVTDLGAIDIERGRDHGVPTYNQMRQAFGLPAKTSFTAITGEATDQFPSDPTLTPGNEINDPNSLDFTSAADLNGAPVAIGLADGTTSVTRRTTTAARLRAIYGNVNNIDAFVGMVAEAHLPGSEFGELQQAMWTRQFQALRDGDRFFYGNDPALAQLQSQYGIDFHTSLAQIIARNTDLPAAEIHPNMFVVAEDDLPPATCKVVYSVATAWPGNFQVALSITNQTSAPLNGWAVRWQFASGQTLSQTWNATQNQSGVNATLTNASWNASIPAGGTVDGVGFNATFDNVTNPLPVNFTLNGKRCAIS
jgi:hypothetical protein